MAVTAAPVIATHATSIYKYIDQSHFYLDPKASPAGLALR